MGQDDCGATDVSDARNRFQAIRRAPQSEATRRPSESGHSFVAPGFARVRRRHFWTRALADTLTPRRALAARQEVPLRTIVSTSPPAISRETPLARYVPSLRCGERCSCFVRMVRAEGAARLGAFNGNRPITSLLGGSYNADDTTGVHGAR